MTHDLSGPGRGPRRPMHSSVAKLVSGGQTGADRAALEAGLALSLEVGGWVPRGRVAEDGVIPSRFPGLVETESPDPAVRTGRNVRDSDATLIVSRGALCGGSRLTLEAARRLGRPVLHLDLARIDAAEALRQLRAWLDRTGPRTLNVAGPRESEDPGIGAEVGALLRAALAAAG